MSCTLTTNRARSLRSLMDRGIISDTQEVLKESEFYDANIQTKKDLENIIGSRVPADVFPFEANFQPEGTTVSVNSELFQRADAAEDIIYPENEQYVNNYQYPIQQVAQSIGDATTALDTKLTDLLKNIGVTVSDLDNNRYKGVDGVADTFHKVAATSINKAGISTLPEEGAHMFVEFIEQNDKALFNKMMADIPKYGIYQEVKAEYLPIYNDINQVKKEAIGKAIAQYLVGNRVDQNVDGLKAWFDKVLNALRKALATFGIITQEDYNNYFELTANKILAGDFVGNFDGRSVYYSTDSSAVKDQSLKLIDERAGLMEIRTVTVDGQPREVYFYNGKQVKYRVTEKVRDKNAKAPTVSTKAIQVGRDGHADLMNLWKIKLGQISASEVTPKTSPIIFSKLGNFVNVIYDQFPGAEFRIEVPIYDPLSDTGGTIDVLIVEPDGTANILDYKFREGSSTKINKDYNKQLGEYRRILNQSYKFRKFGQIRILPFKTEYTGKIEATKTLKDITFGTNVFDSNEERAHLNPQPATFEITKNDRLNRTLQFLNEELLNNDKIRATNELEKQQKQVRKDAIKATIARLQITQDIVALEELVDNDKERMEYLLNKENITPVELIDLYRLKEYYADFINKKYNEDSAGNVNVPLTELSLFAQNNSTAIDQKLEDFFNSQEININQVNKPISWWGRLSQLSDHDNPAFQAFYRLINKGFAQNEMKVKGEYQEIRDILTQIQKERPATGVNIYAPIIQKDAKGKLTNKLIAKNSKAWYDFHAEAWADKTRHKELAKYFDTVKWNEYYKPLEEAFLKQKRSVDITGDKLEKDFRAFKANRERWVGMGNENSRFYNIPDSYLNPDYVTYVKNAPESGLAKLYNKYISINQFARDNSDSDVSISALPYVRKSTIEMLINDGFNFKNLTNNSLDKLKAYEWESFEYDSNGQRVYKIPLRYKSTGFKVEADQSHDLGEMLMLWTESVYNNAYLQETHATALLYQQALKMSKEVSMKNGTPVLENGQFRTTPTTTETLKQYQEYLNMYYYGVSNEQGDRMIAGFSGTKIVRTLMKYLSGNAIGLNVFSGIANVTGGFAQAISIGVKGNHFKSADFFRTIRRLDDPKVRAFIGLVDINNDEFKREKANNLSASKVDSIVAWDKLFILQRGGDWLLQNATLGGMAQNYTVKEGKIVKKEKDDKHLLELLNYDKSGKITIEGLDFNKESDFIELFKFREKARRVGAEITGNTSEYDKYLAKNTLTGQLLLQFRGWIPSLAHSRFGKLKYNANLEEYTIGKMRSTAQLINKNTLKMLDEYIRTQNSPHFDDFIQREYEQQQALNPNLSYDEFRQLYISGLRSTISDAVLLALAYAFFKLSDWDEDDSDQSVVTRFLTRGLARTASEISFFYSPDSFTDIVKMPIPLVGLLTNLRGLIAAGGREFVDTLFGTDYEDKLYEKTTKVVPGVASYYKLMKELDED